MTATMARFLMLPCRVRSADHGTVLRQLLAPGCMQDICSCKDYMLRACDGWLVVQRASHVACMAMYNQDRVGNQAGWI